MDISGIKHDSFNIIALIFRKQHFFFKRPVILLGSFSSKTRTSLKTQLLSYVFRAIIIFQPLPSQKAAYRQTKSLKIVSILAFPSLLNVLIFHFASLFDVLLLQCGLQKFTFQVVSCRIERTISLSRLAKSFEVDFTL